MELNKNRIHKIVEYLKSLKFDEDYFELINLGIDEILRKYGLSNNLTNQEKAEVFKELINFIEENEFNEIERVTKKERKSILSKTGSEVNQK